MGDIEIARSVKLKPIEEVAKKVGIEEEELECYGKFKAKLSNDLIKRISNRILKITFIFAILVFGVFFTFPDALSNIIYNDFSHNRYNIYLFHYFRYDK